MSAGNTRAGNQSPGGAFRSAPYQQPYAAGAASSEDLTAVHTQARVAASGLWIRITAATYSVQWKDCAGNSHTVGGTDGVVGEVWDWPFAAIELTANTGAAVVAYWHGG
jgi:hypothetical protein